MKKWKEEIKNIKDFLPDKLLSLDVGGLYFPKVSKKVLTSVQGSSLEAMFSGRHELPLVDGKIFVERNPKMFEHLIQYLINGCQWVDFDS